MADAGLLLAWRNHDCAFHLSGRPVTAAEHAQWLTTHLASIQIAELGDGRIGQVRLDALNDETVEVDIAVDARYRGRGYGTEILRRAIAGQNRTVRAVVLTDNEPSRRAFERAGFRQRAVVYEHP